MIVASIFFTVVLAAAKLIHFTLLSWWVVTAPLWLIPAFMAVKFAQGIVYGVRRGRTAR